MSNVELAKHVLLENARVRYGVFGVIEVSNCFPPEHFLNEFLKVGDDPCDQDGRMESWEPFSLSVNDYAEVKEWWLANHEGTVETSLGVDCWADWVQIILSN